MVLIPFTVRISDSEADPNLEEKLMAEAPAILRWGIDGALDWRIRGLDVPACIRTASDDYLDDEDHLMRFLSEETISDPNAVLQGKVLHRAFDAWCIAQGLPPARSAQALYKDMEAHNFHKDRQSGGRAFAGLKLRNP